MTQELIVFGCIFGLVVIDYGLGMIGAVVRGNWDSGIMRLGLLHKLSYLFAVVVGWIVQYLVSVFELPYVNGVAIVTLICVWIIITEVSSILENLCVINPNLATNSFMSIFAKRDKTETVDQDILDETYQSVQDSQNRIEGVESWRS